mmetsp:Transcript_1997/g.4016  ORF Transcript_1997/g.4016 Transcript_1997/m.4016 type:complete len:435 (-) Transcript_1997:118-1422(-)
MGLCRWRYPLLEAFFPFLPKVRYDSEQYELSEMVSQFKAEDQMEQFPDWHWGYEHDPNRQHHDAEHAVHNRINDQQLHAYGLSRAPFVTLWQSLSPRNLHQSLSSRMEALVFIHGLGTNLSQPLEKLGLLISLGKCAPHIMPIVFGWGCGNIVMYPVVKNYCLEYASQLKQFFEELRSQVSIVHVIAHSAGADLWLRCFPEFKDKFRLTQRAAGLGQGAPSTKSMNATHWSQGNSSSQGQGSGLQLANVIFLNGDVTVESMVETLPTMLLYADRFTSYNDSRDVATTAGTYIQRLMPRSLQTGWRDAELDSRTETWGRRTQPVWLEPEPNQPQGGEANMLLRGQVVVEVMPNVDTYYEKCPPHGEDKYIDIVDCTHIDTNINIDRHSYFAINALLVEDICECISEKTPARSRAHLIKRHGNVYDFLAAPSTVRM